MYDTNVYTEPDGSKWWRVFRHNNPSSGSLFARTDDFLNGVKKSDDVWFEVGLAKERDVKEYLVKQKLTSSDTEVKFRLTQTVNAMDATYNDTVQGANVVYNTSAGYSTPSYSGGLYHIGTNTYLCWNNGINGNWYGAIGAWRQHLGGIPAIGGEDTIATTGYLELYIPAPPTPTSNSKIYLGSTNLGTGKIRLGANDVSAIYLGTSLIYPPQTPLYQNVVCFSALQANVDIAYTHPDDLGFTPKFYASTDGVNFTQMTKQVPVRLSNIGDKLYIYGDNQYLCNQTDISKYTYFLIQGGNVSVAGDLTTLLDVNGLTTLPDRAFVATLQSTYLISAADLTVNVTSVGDYALYKLFEGNTNMTSGINALPATTLGDYCYARMYYGCEKLTTTPTTLPAMTLTEGCYYQMFYDCTSITTAPELPATTLASGCYAYMFHNCDALVNAPATLPATTTATDCYDGMFNLCENLEKAPEIFADTFNGNMYYMFRQCHSLNYIKVHCTTWDTSGGDNRWVEYVAASGTFTKPTATVIPSGMNGIPTGWTVVNV